jgi:hypothetical protein
MGRTYRDRGHTHPENGTEQRLDALLDVMEELRDLLKPAARERPGQVRLREGGAESEAGEGATPDPSADEDFQAGRRAAAADEGRRAPFPHGRSARARQWYAGFDSVGG